jgi:hypothetical protein
MKSYFKRVNQLSTLLNHQASRRFNLKRFVLNSKVRGHSTKKILAFISLALLAKAGFTQTISKSFFGQNAWMPDTIGDVNHCQEPPCILYGQLHKMWGDIKASGSGVIRFGGIAPDRNMPTNYQYIKMIDAVRANGMEPIIQVPFHMNRYSAAQAAEIVRFLNITNGKGVKYFIIGNEPDLEYKYTTAAQVAVYFKAFATAMKAVDPSIMTVGPEVAWYNTNIINGLTSAGGTDDITGKDANGHYYLDIITFHTYPFNGTQSRQDVIGKLTSAGAFESNLTDLNARLATCNTFHSRSGAAVLKVAVTEANIAYVNAATDGGLYGVGTNSFIGGQFWAEMLGIAMKRGVSFINLWSVSEGNDIASNIGYIDGATKNKKPTYHHFKMLADNFKGIYCNGTNNNPNVKTFGSKDGNQIAVMILNQDQTADFNYTVRLNNNAVSGSNALKINISANVDKEFSGTIANQSTSLLIFDNSGNVVKKIEYKLNGMADLNIPPVVSLFAASVATGVQNANSDQSLSVASAYPNPSAGSFHVKIKVDKNLSESVKMNIINSNGKVVYTSSPSVKNGFIDEKVDMKIGSLPPANGLYTVQTTIGTSIVNIRMVVDL